MPRRSSLILFLLSVATIAPLSAASDEAKTKEKSKLNRLGKESSPYLLQHARNPVDWYPWGPVAFERAKKEKKLIFLSIGYSSCHWCHVMERESFSNPEIARVLNEHFVCIKVDREERPDIDDIYMTALSVTGEQGGWPLTMILTPEGKPIFGGTYFPPADKKVGENTIPGMKSILARVIELDLKEHDALVKQADHIAKLTLDALDRNGRMLALVKLDRELVKAAAEAFEIDTEHGGTGSKARQFQGTKFPRPPVWMFLLEQSTGDANSERGKLVQHTLRMMARGGIYDHLGGGFHRYSTERTWTVPHFEKMLYDNAQLVELYSEAYRLSPDPLFQRVVDETLAFVKREMTYPEGAFYSALDADSNHEEGEFYVWKPDELRAVLGNDAAFFMSVYGDALNFEGKSTILRLAKPLAEVAREKKLTESDLICKLTPLKNKLFEARSKRVRPFLDTKIITAWNGQMIAAYAKAGAVFKNHEYTKAAVTAADFLLSKMRDKNGRLLRLYAAPPGSQPIGRGPAFLDDYSYFVHGLLNLFDATGDRKWLAAAVQLTDLAIQWHGDGNRGGYFFAPSDGEKLFARAKDGYDGVQPSGNSQMARNLVRLARANGKADYRNQAEKTLKHFSIVLRTNPSSMPTLALALHEFLGADMPYGSPAERTIAPKNPRESADVVKAELKLQPPRDGRRDFSVNLSVAAPWHLYANPVGNESLLESQTEVTVLVGGKPVEAAVTYPKGSTTTDGSGAKYRIYEGRLVITGTFPAREGELEIRVKLTACKEATCLLPSTITVK